MSNGVGMGQSSDEPFGRPGGPAIGPVQPVASPYLSPPVAAEPDWAAMADRNEQGARRRKRLRMTGAAVAATVVVGGITATAVAVSGGGHGNTSHGTATADASAAPAANGLALGPDGPPTALPAAASPAATTAAPGTSASASPSPGRGSAKPDPAKSSAKPGATTTAPGAPAAPTSAAPRDPLTLISGASTDTAPLDPATLFSATTLNIGGHTWTRIATDNNATCWQTTTGGLGDVISAQSCRRMLRATYATGNSSVTIGVAVFDQKAQADAAQQAYKGQVQGLAKPDGIHWCVSAGCPGTHAVVGRYAYYTVSGTINPGNNTADAVATAAGPDFAAQAYARLLARGQAAAAGG